MISQRLIEKLKLIVEEDYGKDLSMQEATELAEGLLGYFNLLAKVLHREKEANQVKVDEDTYHPDGEIKLT